MHIVVRRTIQRVSLFLAALLPAFASAEYVVNRIDYVDPDTGAKANFTQFWAANSSGQVVGLASFDNDVTTFTFVYDPASGNYLRVPLPPGFDNVQNFATVTGINDAGVMVGSTFEITNTEVGFLTRGFILVNGTYTFFAHPAWANTTARTISNPTPQFPQGFVVGYVDNNFVDFTNEATAGFVFDVAKSAFATLDGANSLFTIAHGQNAAGQITGSAIELDEVTFRTRQRGFVFMPNAAGDPFSGGSTSYFQINGLRTLARGITRNGTIVAATRDAGTSVTRTNVGTPNAFQQINVPGSTGGGCFESFPTGAFPEHIMDSGQIFGQLTDDSCKNRGVILTPAALPTGAARNGAATFNVNVAAGEPTFINLPVALAYDYAVGHRDPRFAAVRLPLGIGNNKFVLVVRHRAYAVNAGQLFDFREHGFNRGVKRFRVACIDPAAMLDPGNSAAFPTQLMFAQSGTFTGTQKPLATATGARDDDDRSDSGQPMTQDECRERLLSLRDAGGEDDDD